MPGEEGVDPASPEPKVESSQQRPNHGRSGGPVVETRKAIDAQVLCEPIECMLDEQQKCKLQETEGDLAQT